MSELGVQRHHARERALEIFYEATIKDRGVATVLVELRVQPDPYTVALLNSAASNQQRANELIAEFATAGRLLRERYR